jgi:hypothetical protein
VTEIHSDLRRVSWLLPRGVVSRPWMLPATRAVSRLIRPRPGAGVDVTEVRLPVRGRVYRPSARAGTTPALLWIHGGGLVSGTARMDEATCADFARRLGIMVLSVDYRFAPEHQYPTPWKTATQPWAGCTRSRELITTGSRLVGRVPGAAWPRRWLSWRWTEDGSRSRFSS